MGEIFKAFFQDFCPDDDFPLADDGLTYRDDNLLLTDGYSTHRDDGFPYGDDDLLPLDGNPTLVDDDSTHRDGHLRPAIF